MNNYSLEKGKSWKIGDVTIIPIIEILTPPAPALGMFQTGKFTNAEFSQKDIDNLQCMVPDYITEEFKISIAIQSFLLKYDGHNILIDTGANLNPKMYFANLEGAGCKPEDIDMVLFTHLHYDHIAYNVSLGAWCSLNAVFPNAKYYFNKECYDFLKSLQDDPSKRRNNPEYDHIWPFRVQLWPLVEQGRVEFIDYDFTIGDAISVIPMPGHQIGQVGYVVKSKGDSALITGDIVSNVVQMIKLDVSNLWDENPAQSEKTRTETFERLAGTDTLLFMPHVPKPGFVERTKGGYRLIPG